ncbi:hypothetical protein ABPG72_021684 [Tetrahymena utriculariae]
MPPFFVSSICGSVLGTFSAIHELTKGEIKCEQFRWHLYNNLINTEKVIIRDIYFWKGECHYDNLQLSHSYFILKDTKSIKYCLEMLCNSYEQKKITLSAGEFILKYDYSKQVYQITTLQEIIECVQQNFENKTYNSLNQPKHVVECDKKVLEIFFGTSEIKVAKGLIYHAYVIVETETSCWKFEISGAKDRTKLNIQKINNFTQMLKARKKNEFTLKDIKENDKKNKEQVSNHEKGVLGLGALALASIFTSANLGYKIGAVAGPIGMSLGAIAGGVFELLISFSAKAIGSKI